MFRDFLKGQKIPKEIIHIAGPPKSGKTTLIYHLCKGVSPEKKGLIIDCELNFSARRLKEITIDNLIAFGDILVIPTSDSYKQYHTIMNLHNLLESTQFSFIAINGVSNHYRTSASKKEIQQLYQILTLELSYLNLLNNIFPTPIILTNQISLNKVGNKEMMLPVANNIISFYSHRKMLTRQLGRNLWSINVDGAEYNYTISDNGLNVR